MKYFAKIVKKDGSYVVSFPDFKNINTYGDTIEEALSNAEEALNGCIESDFERGFKMPICSKYKGLSYYDVNVAPHIEIAYLLKYIRNGKSQVQIARELGISYQAYQKLENPRKCNPTIKTLEKISKVFGKNLEIHFV